MRLALGIVATVAGIVPMKAAAHDGCHSLRCKERVARKACSQKRPIPCITRAAIHWKVSEWKLRRRAWCESTMNPYAIGGPNRGLFQFNWPGTWSTSRYGMHDVFIAKWNALAAAEFEAIGRGGEWACRG